MIDPVSEGADVQLGSLLESIPDPIWLKGLDGKFLNCNPAFEQLLGHEKSQIIGKTDFDFFDHQQATGFRQKDKEVANATGSIKSEEETTLGGSSKSVLWETIKTAIKDSNGKVIGVLGIAREITVRKKAESLLKERLEAITGPITERSKICFEELFDLGEIQRLQDQFAEATQVASIITHIDGTPITRPSNFCFLCNGIIRKTEKGCQNCYYSDAKIGSYNPEGPNIQRCMSGGLWDAGAAITVGGKHIANWLIGQVRDEAQSEDQILKYAEEIGADQTATLKAFREVPAMSKERFEDISNALYTLAAQLSKSAYQNYLQARNIVEHQQHEKKITLQNEELKKLTEALTSTNEHLSAAVKKAEESDRLKSAFVANMSHEIRTPLNAIVGFSNLLRTERTSEDELKHFAGIISDSGENLLELINNIMDISKIDAGLASIKYESTEVCSFIEQLLELYQSRLRQKGQSSLQIKLSISEESITFFTDQVRLRQIFENLISNALKFTSSGTIEIGCRSEEEQLQFWVRDTGIGIDPQQHSSIFERFQQANNSTEKLYGGTGLGLSIVKSCVEMMGGQIWLKSALGEGSTFFFSLPYKRAEAINESCGQATPTTQEFNNEHILIAEDDEVNFQYLKSALKTCRLRISRARNGEEAIQQLRENQDIRLILMDIRMPVMDGLQAAERIRKENLNVPIIAQTAYASLADREACLKAGCNGYISKPTKKADLLQEMRKYL